MSMPGIFNLLIITPEKVFFRSEVTQLIITTPEGDMGVMVGHMPVITVVPESLIKIESEGKWQTAVIGQGFLEVASTHAELFVDTAEWPQDIDIARTEAALHRAEERLRGNLSHTEYLRTHAAVARATVRIKAAKGS